MTKTPESFDNSIPVLTDVVVPGKPEYARAASAQEAVPFDAEQIADRLRGRVSQLLSAEAHALIETRCQEALREHSPKFVQDITRQVTLALESSMREWVGKAVEEELRRQRGS